MKASNALCLVPDRAWRISNFELVIEGCVQNEDLRSKTVIILKIRIN